MFVATGFFNSEVWSWFGLVMSYLLNFIHFSRHQVYSMMITLYQQILAMQALVRCSLDYRPHMRRWAHLVEQRSQARGEGKTVLGIMESKDALADPRLMRSQEMGKVVVLSAVQPQPIRAGPIRYRPKRSDPLRDVDRQAA